MLWVSIKEDITNSLNDDSFFSRSRNALSVHKTNKHNQKLDSLEDVDDGSKGDLISTSYTKKSDGMFSCDLCDNQYKG